MKQKRVTTRFLRALGAFLVKHPEDEKRIEKIMNQIVVGKYAGLHIHPLHGPLKGLSAARISQQYRLVFVQEPQAIIFIGIGSHDEVY
jgi:mRNA-degrading endonuclease YafQ of YafQ-DinJ toxin-antitoxin module